MSAEIVKLFLGALDTGELALMCDEAEKRGFQSISSPEEVTDLVKGKKSPIIIIEGGFAGICVPEAARLALQAGASNVYIDLRRIRTGYPDYRDDGSLDLSIIKSHFLSAFEDEEVDPRIHLAPEEVETFNF